MEQKSRQNDNSGPKHNSFYVIWEIIKPLVIYYVTYNAAQILLLFLYSMMIGRSGNGLQEYLLVHAQEMTELVNSISGIIGVLPLIPMLKKELAVCEHTVNCTSVFLTVILAASASVGFNILMTITGFVQISAAYQSVADRQFGLAFGAGLILFGLISPVTEEIVFRGLIFNRMRCGYPAAAAILASGVLFGVFHGNLVQGVYGGCMGILIAYAYERMHSFVIPCLFHVTANVIVYTLSQNSAMQVRLFTIWNCVILFIVSVTCIIIIERKRVISKKENEN